MTLPKIVWMIVPLALLACDTSRAPVGADSGPGADQGDATRDRGHPDGPGPGDLGRDLQGTCPCTDPAKCKEPWTCSASGDSCSREMPRPNSQAGWTCTWLSPMRYFCTNSASSPFPPGASHEGWYCGFRQSSKAHECLRSVTPHPCSESRKDGAWSCQVKGTTLQCHFTGSPRVSSPAWSCWTEGTRKLCKVTQADRGLPPSGNSWRCHRPGREGHLQWLCHGTAAATPSGAGWTCAKETAGGSLFRCLKMLTTHDLPTGDGYWVTAKGSAMGTQSEEMTPGVTSLVNYPCKEGHRMWCDGLQYGGWGHARCTPAGKWETRMQNGKAVLDCKEQSGGQRPDTRCACYHFYLNPDCCERPDCIVPAGGAGRVCPKSAGALCDHCNPVNPECAGDQARCIVTNAHETFCGSLCSDAKPCPAGYSCMEVKLKVGKTKQCVPADFSCYY